MLKEGDFTSRPCRYWLTDIGCCPLNIVYNAYGKGMEACGHMVEHFVFDLLSLFKVSTTRREEYKAK